MRAGPGGRGRAARVSPRSPRRTDAMSPPVSRAAAATSAATPGGASKSLASASASSDPASMPLRASCHDQIRARMRGGGRRSSSANFMRRRNASGMPSLVFAVHSVGTGAFSSSRFMNSFDPPETVPRREPPEQERQVVVGKQIHHLVEQNEGIPAGRQQGVREGEVAEPLGAVGLAAAAVFPPHVEQRHAQLFGQRLAELGLSGSRRSRGREC